MRWSSGKAAVAAGFVLAAVLGGPAAAAGPTVQSEPCEQAQSGETGAFYPGAAASQTYEELFAESFALPHLGTHVPQGITVWENWNGKKQTILVVSMYRKIDDVGQKSYLVAIDPATGKHAGTVEVAAGHLGGIAIAGNYLFGQDADKKAPTKEPVRRYKLSKLSVAFAEAQKKGNRPYVGRESGLQTIHGAGFMQAYKGEIWAGHFNIATTDKMYRYKVSSSGKLTVNGSGYEVPARTQGVLITSDRFIFNVGYGQGKAGRMIVAERKNSLKDAAQHCFATPSMGENMARLGNRVIAVYEGGSFQYPRAVNRVTHAHEAPLDRLLALPLS